MLRELYERDTVLLFKKIIKPGMVIVDIGAHIGYYTRIFSRLVGKSGLILAFEADPANFELLKKNTARLKNVKIRQSAVTDKTGTIDFYHYEEKSGVGSILSNIPLDFKKVKITVKSRDLDSALAEEKISRVDVIKMDIEGGESLAIKGMRGTLGKNMDLAFIVEFAPAWVKASGHNPDQFLADLGSFGFKIFAITKEGSVELGAGNQSYEKFIPKSSGSTPSGEFINLYCTKKDD